MCGCLNLSNTLPHRHPNSPLPISPRLSTCLGIGVCGIGLSGNGLCRCESTDYDPKERETGFQVWGSGYRAAALLRQRLMGNKGCLIYNITNYAQVLRRTFGR